MDDIYVVVADNDQTIEMRGKVYTDDMGPLVFEQYTELADIETIRKRAKQLSLRYGRCRIAKITFTGEEYL